MKETKTYRAWCNMKARCNNPNASAYKNYGGRGIKVCERWNTSFANFLEDMGEKPSDMTLDRIDVNGNYEKSNCRWISLQMQNNNRRDTLWVNLNGEKVSAKIAALRLSYPYERVRWAVQRYGDDWILYCHQKLLGKVNNQSGYKGVSFHKASGRYHARLYINRSCSKSLGYHETAMQANEAIVRAAAEIGKTL
jgi:hypothetical protein